MNSTSEISSTRLETRAEELKIIYEDKTSLYDIIFYSSDADMKLSVSLTPNSNNFQFSSNELFLHLDNANIKVEIPKDKVSEFCKLVNNHKLIKDFPLSEGKRAIKGRDQWIEFFVKPLSKSTYKKDENFKDIKKDYHNQHLFDNIKEGDLIAEIHDPTEGTDGVNIFGQTVESVPGLKFDKNLTLTRNISLSQDKKKIFTNTYGLVLYDKLQNKVTVSDTLRVQNVGLLTGDIDFIGKVIIDGDVEDTFNVKAEKEIIVKGHVGASRLESKTDIEIHGIDGKDEGEIICGGDLKAYYIHNVKVTAENNVIVHNEIINSQLHIEGSLLAERASIIGGDCIALHGIEVSEVGSHAVIPTILTAGISYQDRERCAELRKELLELETQMIKVNSSLNVYLLNPKILVTLNDAGKEKVRKLADTLKELVTKKDSMEQEVERLHKHSVDNANPVINILKMVYPSVKLVLGTKIINFNDPKTLRTTITIDSNNEIKLGVYRKL
jgi:uncharacterized protein (DUF342 family)